MNSLKSLFSHGGSFRRFGGPFRHFGGRLAKGRRCMENMKTPETAQMEKWSLRTYFLSSSEIPESPAYLYHSATLACFSCRSAMFGVFAYDLLAAISFLYFDLVLNIII